MVYIKSARSCFKDIVSVLNVIISLRACAVLFISLGIVSLKILLRQILISDFISSRDSAVFIFAINKFILDVPLEDSVC